MRKLTEEEMSLLEAWVLRVRSSNWGTWDSSDYPLEGCQYLSFDCDGVQAIAIKFDGGIIGEFGDKFAGIAFGAPRGHLPKYLKRRMPSGVGAA